MCRSLDTFDLISYTCSPLIFLVRERGPEKMMAGFSAHTETLVSMGIAEFGIPKWPLPFINTAGVFEK